MHNRLNKIYQQSNQLKHKMHMKNRIIQGFITAMLVSVLAVTPVFATSIDDMKEDGIGNLYIEFEKLKKKLELSLTGVKVL